MTVVEGPTPVDLESVLRALREATDGLGIEAYLVGGFVRDRLLGRESKDIDVLTVGGDHGGQRLLGAVAATLGWGRPQLFERFGTGQVRGDGFIVEVVDARAERYDPASRRPAVAPGSLDDDVWRRDFTVNALCQTFAGEVVDRTGRGLSDLSAGVLRTPLDPAQTFSEDPLRMLRAARFCSQLEMRLADGTLEGMRATAERVEMLSAERVRDELRRLLVGSLPSAGIDVLSDATVLERVLPEIAAMEGVVQDGWHDSDVYRHTLRALDQAPPELLTRTAVLLHDVGKPPCAAVDARGRHTFHDHAQVGAQMATAILERLRFSTDEVRAVSALVRLHLRPIQYSADTHSDAAVRRLIRDAGALRARLLEVARADTRASAYPTTAGIDELEARMAALDAGSAISRRRPVLDGRMLMELAGRGPGPWVGRAQRALDEEVLEGRLAPGDAAAAIALIAARPELLG